MNLAAPEAASTTETKLHRIIIVGGGAGGLELATQLGDKLGRKGKAEITLVDRARTHIWKPLLHEIAAGSMDTGRHELPYQAQGHWHGFQYRYGEMIGIDRANKRIHLAPTHDEDGREITPDRWFSYDTLVIAIGSISSDFGTPGVKEHAIMLDTRDNSLRGGTGRVFDWSIAQQVSQIVPKLYLAGGLSPENVEEAISRVRPYAVDACSSLENSPGTKNHGRMRAFVDTVRSVNP